MYYFDLCIYIVNLLIVFGSVWLAKSSAFDHIWMFPLCMLIAFGVSNFVYYGVFRYIRKRIMNYQKSFNIESLNLYMDKCIKIYKYASFVSWLKIYKLILLVLQGKIAECKMFVSSLKQEKMYTNETYKLYIKKTEAIIDFLTNGTISVLSYEFDMKDCLDVTLYLLQNEDKMTAEDIINHSLIIYDSDYQLFKSIIATVQCKKYRNIGEFDKAVIYEKDAREYAPSQEVLDYILKLIDGTMYCIKTVERDEFNIKQYNLNNRNHIITNKRTWWIILVFLVIIGFGLTYEFVSDKLLKARHYIEEQTSKAGVKYTTVLEPGIHTVGTHIPEGNYEIEIISGEHGKITVYNSEGKQIDFFSVEKDDKALIKTVDIPNSGYLVIDTGIVVKFHAEKIWSSELFKVENPLTEEIIVQGKMIAGTDFPEGVYDICFQSDEEKGYVNFIFPNEDSGSVFFDSDIGVQTYHNVVFSKDTILELENLSSVVLIPSSNLSADHYREFCQ